MPGTANKALEVRIAKARDVSLIHGVKQGDEADSATWDGDALLDPDNGKAYKMRLTPIEDDKKLQVRGHIGVPAFGRTQVWVRAG